MGNAKPSTPRTDAHGRRAARVSDSWVSLLILGGVLASGALIRATTTSATLFGLQGPRCPVDELFGPGVCPGWGLTRSVTLSLHDHLATAWALNPAGPLVVLLCGAGILVHLHILAFRRRGAGHALLLRAGQRAFVTGVAATWLLRLMGV